MSIQTLSRCGLGLVLVVLLAGCSMGGHGDRDSECNWNRSKCMYEGSYEPGEEGYAEEQAKRLNQAQSVKMRRKSSWW